ncbi:transcriptional regulator [Pseudomonas sp. MS19]|uniref:PA3496 family putative envelope integrity protein n=1 Tax=Pseudomonas sp. MS19 TaxID=2579939 RepID=UPI001561C375|nr:transcriptional regulator [Pseudomonas sp. MS19]NRH27594.1 transcriptional regulator [Pseudomonas sp. MS19]
MPRHLEESLSVHNTDAKARRKVIDQRRMEYRRAIESYAEQRMLQHELADFPEIIAANYLAGAREFGRQTARPAG